MSLYDGLGVEKDQTKAAGWSSSFDMLKTQLQARKATLTKAKNEKTKQATITPVINFNKLRQDDSPMVSEGNNEPKVSVFLGGEVIEKFFDEYDPLHPNDYEKLTRKDKEERDKRNDADRDKELEERRKRRAARHAQQGINDGGLVRKEEDDDYDKSRSKHAPKAAIAPPTALLEQDSVPLTTLGNASPPKFTPPSGAGIQIAKNLRGSVAHKIMSKYGFKEGKGLGKDNRGMSHALQVEKTSKRGGKIISSEQQQLQLEQQAEEEMRIEQQEQKSVTDLLKNPTKVLCLRNMVGPGEVDNELQDETSEECTKYGQVVKCIIYEMHGVSDDEAIRIFIEFDRLESAIKGLVDLNGRFFGGRSVKASFYDPIKFKSFQLAEPIT